MITKIIKEDLVFGFYYPGLFGEDVGGIEKYIRKRETADMIRFIGKGQLLNDFVLVLYLNTILHYYYTRALCFSRTAEMIVFYSYLTFTRLCTLVFGPFLTGSAAGGAVSVLSFSSSLVR